MALMLAGLALFLGLHSLPIVKPAREAIYSRLGEAPYKIGYSILSLIGLVMIGQGYNAWVFQGSPLLYDPPTWLGHISLLLMAVAFIVLAATYGPNHIKKAIKHPMITAVKIWALAHLLANGHAAAVTLFTAFLAWGVVERISVKRREAAGEIAPGAFEPKITATLVSLTVGIVVYVLFVWKLHLWLIGVSPIAT